MAFCTECGANVPEDVKFCTGCGKPVAKARETVAAVDEMAVQTAADWPPQNQPIQTAPPPTYAPLPQTTYQAQADTASGKYAVIGVGGYIGMMILFTIPVVGWIACIVMAFSSHNQNRRNFARAMLVFMVIGVILSAALFFVLIWAAEVLVEYAIEAAGGAVGDANGLKELFNILSGLDELNVRP